jgi:hypothetical protein
MHVFSVFIGGPVRHSQERKIDQNALIQNKKNILHACMQGNIQHKIKPFVTVK